MRTLKLGHSGEQVSALSLGTMYFGTKVDEPTSCALLDQYADAGGSFIDTANNYAFWVDGFHGGESETVVGRWTHRRRNRDKMFLATKLGFNTPPQRPLSLRAASIREELAGSLRRLQTDYVDLLYAHTDDRDTPLDETLATFDDLIREGQVRYIGCSNTLTWRIEQARQLSERNSWAQYCCVQQRHSYLRPKATVRAFGGAQVPVTAELRDYLEARKDAFAGVAYSTLLGGVYADDRQQIPEGYQPEDYDRTTMAAQFRALREVAAEQGATANQVVLAWIMQNTPGMVALVSSSSPERLRENLGADNVTLSAEQIQRLNEA